MQKISEEALVKLLKDPQEQRNGFTVLVNKYSSQLYWQIRRMVVFHEDANDLLQNTFLKAWSNIDSFRGEAKLSTWLYRIAANECLTFLQQKKEAVSIDSDEISLAQQLTSDSYFDGEEIDRRLQEVLQSLPEKQRLVFNLKYYENIKYEEMSQMLNTSVGALKASYHIAVKKIEAFFTEAD